MEVVTKFYGQRDILPRPEQVVVRPRPAPFHPTTIRAVSVSGRPSEAVQRAISARLRYLDSPVPLLESVIGQTAHSASPVSGVSKAFSSVPRLALLAILARYSVFGRDSERNIRVLGRYRERSLHPSNPDRAYVTERGVGRRRVAESMLTTEDVEGFSVALEEAARADEAGTSRFVEPAAGTLRRALSNRHHLVFGRRGSGKTSLLQKARSELVAERRPNAFIDMEKFKAHSYPDVLISVVMETFSSVSEWLQEGAVAPANKRSFWIRIRPSRKPLQKSESQRLAALLDEHVRELRALLYAQDGSSVDTLRRGEASSASTVEASAEAAFRAAGARVASELSQTSSTVEESRESIRRSKIDFLHRRILDYQKTLRDIVALSGQNGFVLLDDLYYIRRSDQPEVLDYFHRLFKGSGLWLKVGTIRHRSEWYRHGDPPIGIEAR